MSIDHDPYFAGRVVVEPDRPIDHPGPVLAGWIMVYCSNLVVPMMFASAVTSESGRYGMAVAMLVLFAAGCFVVARDHRLGKAMVIGGGVVAALQVIPIIQFVAGSLGLMAASPFVRPGEDLEMLQVTSELGGFVATLVTGSLLCLAGLGFGLVQRWIWAARTPEPDKATGPMPEWGEESLAFTDLDSNGSPSGSHRLCKTKQDSLGSRPD